ncbi:MAG: hypothetical protein JSS79_15265 [Bacteroidetes bacterium]|nr:hypothetical protein [Bacteroidota bacterium]
MFGQPRKVGFRTIVDLVKRRPTHLFVGALLTAIPLFASLVLFFIFSLMASDVPNVDYDLLNHKGAVAKAKITSLTTKENVTINDEHPSVIHYRYAVEGKEIESSVEVLSSNRVSRLSVGDSVEIRHLNGASIITGLESASLPLGIVVMALAPILFIGLLVLALLYLRVNREVKIYRYGDIRNAELISINTRSGIIAPTFRQNLVVHYQYTTTRGERILGEQETSDVSLFNHKKSGDTIKIFVLPEDESKSALISRLDEVRNNWTII